MTNSNSEKPEQDEPQALYREYQTLRDNIPLPIYSSISAAAQEARNQDNIEVILQRAKTHQSDAQFNASTEALKQPSLISRLADLVLGERSSSGGLGTWRTAFASLMVAALAIPLILNFNSSNTGYAELDHFENCADCLSYIQNATVNTRSAIPGFHTFEPKQRYEARLGRIYADLKILTAIEARLDEQDIEGQMRRVRALPSNFYGPNLAVAITETNVNADSLIEAIERDQEMLPSSAVFLAAQGIEIANITARRAASEQVFDQVRPSLENALSQYEPVVKSPQGSTNILAENTFSKLQALNASETLLSDKAQMSNLVTLYTQALQSLGI